MEATDVSSSNPSSGCCCCCCDALSNINRMYPTWWTLVSCKEKRERLYSGEGESPSSAARAVAPQRFVHASTPIGYARKWRAYTQLKGGNEEEELNYTVLLHHDVHIHTHRYKTILRLGLSFFYSISTASAYVCALHWFEFFFLFSFFYYLVMATPSFYSRRRKTEQKNNNNKKWGGKIKVNFTPLFSICQPDAAAVSEVWGHITLRRRRYLYNVEEEEEEVNVVVVGF